MRTLADIVEDTGPMAVSNALGWSYRLARGVVEFHRFGVTHGGISPLCVRAEGPACDALGGLVDPREVATLPGYHSLPRLEGAGLSMEDDCWAIVATLYFLLTGKPPFSGLTTNDVKQRLRGGEPPAMRTPWNEDAAMVAFFTQRLNPSEEVDCTGVKELVKGLLALSGEPVALKALPALEQRDELDDEQQSDAVTVLRTLHDLQSEAEQLGQEGVLSAAFARLKPSSRKPQLTVPTVDSNVDDANMPGSGAPVSSVSGAGVPADEVQAASSSSPGAGQLEPGTLAEDEGETELGVGGTVVMKLDDEAKEQARALRAEALGLSPPEPNNASEAEAIVVRSSSMTGPNPDERSELEKVAEQGAQPPLSGVVVAMALIGILVLALALASLMVR